MRKTREPVRYVREERFSVDLPSVDLLSAVGKVELHFPQDPEIQTAYGAKALNSSYRHRKNRDRLCRKRMVQEVAAQRRRATLVKAG